MAALLAAAGSPGDPCPTGEARAARAVLDPVADHLATAVHLLAVTYDVDRIVLGGGVAEIGEPLLELVGAGLARMAERSGFVASLELPDRLALAPAGPVGAIGAAVLAATGPGPGPEARGRG